METGKEYIANATLAKDENKIRKQQSDLSEFCNLLNRLFAEFVKKRLYWFERYNRRNDESGGKFRCRADY